MNNVCIFTYNLYIFEIIFIYNICIIKIIKY